MYKTDITPINNLINKLDELKQCIIDHNITYKNKITIEDYSYTESFSTYIYTYKIQINNISKLIFQKIYNWEPYFSYNSIPIRYHKKDKCLIILIDVNQQYLDETINFIYFIESITPKQKLKLNDLQIHMEKAQYIVDDWPEYKKNILSHNKKHSYKSISEQENL